MPRLVITNATSHDSAISDTTGLYGWGALDIPANSTVHIDLTAQALSALADQLQDLVDRSIISYAVTDDPDVPDDIETGAVASTATTADISLYVDVVAGSDTNTGSSASDALATIQAAIDRLPGKIAHECTINVAAGTYPEHLGIYKDIEGTYEADNGSYTWKGGKITIRCDEWVAVPAQDGTFSASASLITGSTSCQVKDYTVSGASWTAGDLSGLFLKPTTGSHANNYLPAGQHQPTTDSVIMTRSNIGNVAFTAWRPGAVMNPPTSGPFASGGSNPQVTISVTPGVSARAVEFVGFEFAPAGANCGSVALNQGGVYLYRCAFTAPWYWGIQVGGPGSVLALASCSMSTASSGIGGTGSINIVGNGSSVIFSDLVIGCMTSGVNRGSSHDYGIHVDAMGQGDVGNNNYGAGADSVKIVGDYGSIFAGDAIMRPSTSGRTLLANCYFDGGGMPLHLYGNIEMTGTDMRDSAYYTVMIRGYGWGEGDDAWSVPPLNFFANACMFEGYSACLAFEIGHAHLTFNNCKFQEYGTSGAYAIDLGSSPNNVHMQFTGACDLAANSTTWSDGQIVGPGIPTEVTSSDISNSAYPWGVLDTRLGSHSSGSITCVAVASLIDGETVTIDDGVNAASVFEFDVAGDGVGGGNVQVNVSGVSTAQEVRDLLLAAIQGEYMTGALKVKAQASSSTVEILLWNELPYFATGDVAITETVANAGFVVRGMSGGAVLKPSEEHVTLQWGGSSAF